MQENIIWKKSNYKLFKEPWGIPILLEAGYQIIPAIENTDKYMKVTDKIYFYPSLLPYPNSDADNLDNYLRSTQTNLFPPCQEYSNI